MVGALYDFVKNNGSSLLNNSNNECSSKTSDGAWLLLWAENLTKCAVMELVAHEVSVKDIMEELNLTDDQLYDLYPTRKEIKEYTPVCVADEPSEEKLDEAYQKHFGKENSNNSGEE